jgi:hypothetical protein
VEVGIGEPIVCIGIEDPVGSEISLAQIDGEKKKKRWSKGECDF